jgi:hypothetical protein
LCLGLAAMLGACDAEPLDEPVAAAENAVTTFIRVDVGQHDRWMKRACRENVCLEWAEEDTSGGLVKECMRYGADCEYPARVTLHSDHDTATSGTPISAMDHPGDPAYLGCGPKAAQNVLRFFDVEIPLASVRTAMTTYGSGDNVATLPSDLAGGLQKLLDKYGKGTYVVHRLSGQPVPKIKNLLVKGSPVIILTRGGSHYVTITGYQNASYQVIDYVGNDRLVPEDEIGLGISSSSSWLGLFPFWDLDSYKSGTMIWVERFDTCECTGSQTHTGPHGCVATCDGCYYGLCQGGEIPPDPTPPPGGQPY